MASITKQRIGKYTYLYESISFRDAQGRPRNKKTRVGKIDPKTGETIYTAAYAEKNPDRVIVTRSSVQAEDACLQASQILDSVKGYGVFWFLCEAAKQIGLWDVLRKVFPAIWQEIFTLASYLVVSDKPVMYCEDWLCENEWLPVGSMSSQRISDLLTAITYAERNNFYRTWCAHIKEREYIALDITSVSSYSQQNADCEWGHNRDNDKLPQINLCMLFGEKSRLPVYQTNYSGSLGDVTTLETTINEWRALIGVNDAVMVMDKGFYSARNVNMLLGKGLRFLISMPFTNNFAKALVRRERSDIDHVSNVILTSGAPIRGVHRFLAWGAEGVKLHFHIYFDPERALKERNALFEHVTRLKEFVTANPDSDKFKAEANRYLISCGPEKADAGYAVHIREDAIAKSLETAGWFLLISNHIDSPQEAFDVYRMKDVVEKGFWKYKNCLGLDRLRVHGNERAENKTFIAFLALILASYVHNTMKDKQLYKVMTFDRLFLTLAKLKSAVVTGTPFLRPLSKQLKDIFLAFDLPSPSL